MNKVILTQEQAESLELTLEKANENKDLALGWISPALHHRKPLNKKFSSLKELSVGEIARALYIGYEVEPEFKVGDWVITGRGVIGKYKNESNGIYEFVLSDGYYATSDNLRHATPSEIAEEKERRWWAKHGRDVREVRSGDIIYSYSTGVTFVRNDNARHVTSFDGFQVVCFVENRLDVKDDE